VGTKGAGRSVTFDRLERSGQVQAYQIRVGAARTAEVQDLLRFLGYNPVSVAVILERVDETDGDPNLLSHHIRFRDREAVADLLRVYSPAHGWPSWCDESRWEPSDSDRQWWARQTATAEIGGVPCR
jgi:hypothetical protein